MKNLILSLSLIVLLLSPSIAQADAITAAVTDEARPLKQRDRDEYRNPQQTLRFFDIQGNMAVAEISPGGGWYGNILAPLLKEKGSYYAAHFYVDEDSNAYFKKSREGFMKKVASEPGYANAKVTAFHPTKALDFAPAASLDRVLTFRNIHNWYMRQGEEGLASAFAAFYKALKIGGILGLVEHRMPESMSDEKQLKSGYMKQSYVIALAEKAGFTLLAESDINQNSMDKADHEKGVWTLPPRLALGEQDKAKYLAIGESNRMTLKFVKAAAK